MISFKILPCLIPVNVFGLLSSLFIIIIIIIIIIIYIIIMINIIVIVIIFYIHNQYNYSNNYQITIPLKAIY